MNKTFSPPAFLNDVSPMIFGLFASRPDHPLANAKEVKLIIAELPLDNALKAVDEVCSWLDSLYGADGFHADDYFDAIRLFDEAAQPHLRHLARDYLHARRLSPADEYRLWSANAAYWEKIAGLYAACMERHKRGESLGALLPLAAARLLAARATQLKWIEYRYGPVNHALWLALGQTYLEAEAGAYAEQLVQLYPSHFSMTSVTLQYLQALVLHASSMDSLSPLEIELVDRLISHFLPCFAFSTVVRGDSVYWIDAARDAPPARLVRQPPEASMPSLRFFAPGTAPQALKELILKVERGEVPEELSLGRRYSAKVLLPVLRHLALYWAANPPSRAHRRHNVDAQIAILHGFENSFSVFSESSVRQQVALHAVSGTVENVNLGGFGVEMDNLQSDWLKVGSLLSMQPEGGENWVLGVVQRCNKNSDSSVSVGIQSIARQALSVELRPRSSGLSMKYRIRGIWLREGNQPGETRVVLPAASFDLRESLEFSHEGREYLLTPVALEASDGDYEIARYRERVAD